MPAPSFSSLNPFADDLAHYLAPLQHQMICNYMQGDRRSGDGGPLGGGGPGGGGPLDGGIGGPGPSGGGPPGLPDRWWHRHHGAPMILAGLTEQLARYSGEADENAEFWFHQLDHYFNANGVTNQDSKGDNLLSFLTGEACSLYQRWTQGEFTRGSPRHEAR